MPLDKLPVPGEKPLPVDLPSPFSDVARGKIPAVIVPPIRKDSNLSDPALTFVATNLPDLVEVGLEFYDTKNLETVVYNPERVSENELKRAEEKGTLPEIATPLAPPAPPAEATPEPGLAALSPIPAAPAPQPAPAPGVASARLSNIRPPGPGIKPNPVPTQLAKRPI